MNGKGLQLLFKPLPKGIPGI